MAQAAGTAAASTTIVAWGNNGRGLTNVPPDLTDAVAVSAGDTSNLTLRRDGTVVAWKGGTNLADVPTDLADVTAIAAGGSCHLALTRGGTVVSWGDPTYTNLPPGLSDVVALANGGNLSVALKSDGTMVAWQTGYLGSLASKVTNLPAALGQVVAVAANGYTWFALRNDGRIVTRADTNTPPDDSKVQPLPGLSNVVTLAALTNGFLALRSDGTVVGSTGEPLSPALTNVVDIAARMENSMALRADGTVATVSWGWSGTLLTNPPAGLSQVTAITAGGRHSVALIGDGPPMILSQPMDVVAYSGRPALMRAMVAGSVPLSYQWQHNGTNVVGATNRWVLLEQVEFEDAGHYVLMVTNAQGWARSTEATLGVLAGPPAITRNPRTQTVSLGAPVSFSVEATGSLPLRSVHWEFNGVDIAGTADPSLTWPQARSADAGRYRAIVWNDYGFDVSEEAQLTVVPVLAWGNDTWGETDLIESLTNAIAVAAGAAHTVALKADGTVVAWGSNWYGESDVPTNVADVVAVSAGAFHSLALTGAGSVVAWGANDTGQCSVPAGLFEAVAVAGGGGHSLALLRNGTVAAWGANTGGQTEVPPGLTNAVAVSAGSTHSVALLGNGSVLAWGANFYGETNVPQGLSNVVALASGNNHILALRADGRVVAWGENYLGQATVPPELTNAVVVAAGDDYSLALTREGEVVGWGWNVFGQARYPGNAYPVVGLAAGDYHTVALLSEEPPVRFEVVGSGFGEPGFSVSLPTVRGHSYRLEFKELLAATSWTMLPPVPGDGAVKTLTDPAPFGSQRFYRVRRW
jgi:alpha-tubulin suppressor-like RCC1 family protein